MLLMGAKGMGEQLSAPQGLAGEWTVVLLGSLMSVALGATPGRRYIPQAWEAGQLLPW